MDSGGIKLEVRSARRFLWWSRPEKRGLSLAQWGWERRKPPNKGDVYKSDLVKPCCNISQMLTIMSCRDWLIVNADKRVESEINRTCNFMYSLIQNLKYMLINTNTILEGIHQHLYLWMVRLPIIFVFFYMFSLYPNNSTLNQNHIYTQGLQVWGERKEERREGKGEWGRKSQIWALMG